MRSHQVWIFRNLTRRLKMACSTICNTCQSHAYLRRYQQIGRFVDSLSRSVIVFIIRDPRDIAVSLAYYLASQKDYHITASLFHAMPADERISRVITGDYPIPIYLNRYLNLSGNIRELLLAVPLTVRRHVSQRLACSFRGYHWG